MSNLFSLNLRDFGKGLFVAILTAVISYLGGLTNLMTVDTALIVKIAITSGLAYIVKNLISDNDGKILGAF